MGLGAMGIAANIWKSFISSIRTCYQLIRNHPFILGVLLFFFLLYRYLPSAFVYLVTSVPILVCTAVLLGNFLSYGYPKIRKVEDEDKKKKREICSLNAGLARDVIAAKEESFSAETKARKRRDIKQKAAEDVGVSNGDNQKSSKPAETSSLDGSVVNTIPLLDDELHPLLNSKPPQPALISANDSDAASDWSHKSNNGSDDLGEEAASPEEEAEDEEEETQGGQEDGIKAVEWTEDDEKNLMDLGTSELERNQRLENLIAKRRARKYLRMDTEKYLIDLDSNESQSQIAPISITNTNPFDLPDGSETFPGSSASTSLPRRNPFDIPYDPNEERPNLMGGSFDKEFEFFLPVQPKEMHYCRHESFILGPSFFPEPNQKKCDVKLNPYFVTERMASDRAEMGYPAFHRQFSVIDPRMSYVPESESLSSTVDHEDHEKLIEQELSQEGQYRSQLPEVVRVGDIHQEDKGKDNLGMAGIKEVKNKTIQNMEVESSLPDTSDAYEKLEIAEEKYGGLSPFSSFSSEATTKKITTVKEDEGLGKVESMMHDGTEGSSDNSTQPSIAVMHSHPMSIVVKADDSQTDEEPVYDSSPSANEKTTIEEENMFYVGKRVFLGSTSSLASDLQVEVSEVGSPPSISRTISQADLCTNKDISSYSDEQRPREVTDISKSDAIDIKLSDVDQNCEDHIPAVPTVPESVVVVDQPLINDSSLTILPKTTEVGEGTMDQVPSSNFDPEIEVEVQEILASPAKGQPSTEKSIVHEHSDPDHEQPQGLSALPMNFTEKMGIATNMNEEARNNSKSTENFEGDESYKLKGNETVEDGKAVDLEMPNGNTEVMSNSSMDEPDFKAQPLPSSIISSLLGNVEGK